MHGAKFRRVIVKRPNLRIPFPDRFADRLRGTMAGAAAKTGKPVETLLDERRLLNPTRRFGTAQEFGAFCAFLCSQHAGYVTGQNLLLDGGAYPGTY